jgi:hypothetical protein
MELSPAEEPGGMTWQEVKDFLDHIRVTCVEERQMWKERARRAETLVAELAKGLHEAYEMVDSWGAYAGDYFQEKWDLEGDLRQLAETYAKYEAWAGRERGGGASPPLIP